jgi:aconitase B
MTASSSLIASARESLDRWDRAFAALKRRDFDEYDRITGFKMPEHSSTRDGSCANNALPTVK